MPKAVLVMDLPESCSKCKFLYEFQGIKKMPAYECVKKWCFEIITKHIHTETA